MTLTILGLNKTIESLPLSRPWPFSLRVSPKSVCKRLIDQNLLSFKHHRVASNVIWCNLSLNMQYECLRAKLKLNGHRDLPSKHPRSYQQTVTGLAIAAIICFDTYTLHSFSLVTHYYYAAYKKCYT